MNLIHEYEHRPGPVVVRQEAWLASAKPGRETFRVPPWGYLEAIELILPEPIRNMDHAAPIVCTVELRGPTDEPIGGWRAVAVSRSLPLGGLR